jgi:hypothetical protein
MGYVSSVILECGHVNHTSCFDSYVSSRVEASPEKEVTCPVCYKSLNRMWTRVICRSAK